MLPSLVAEGTSLLVLVVAFVFGCNSSIGRWAGHGHQGRPACPGTLRVIRMSGGHLKCLNGQQTSAQFTRDEVPSRRP